MTISVLTVVEASSEEEARQWAEERQPITLCYQCGGSREQDELKETRRTMGYGGALPRVLVLANSAVRRARGSGATAPQGFDSPRRYERVWQRAVRRDGAACRNWAGAVWLALTP
jgi:hypothetical protein